MNAVMWWYQTRCAPCSLPWGGVRRCEYQAPHLPRPIWKRTLTATSRKLTWVPSCTCHALPEDCGAFLTSPGHPWHRICPLRLVSVTAACWNSMSAYCGWLVTGWNTAPWSQLLFHLVDAFSSHVTTEAPTYSLPTLCPIMWPWPNKCHFT